MNATLKAAPNAFAFGFCLAELERILGAELDNIATRYELSRGILLLDQAVDECVKDDLQKQEGTAPFADGASLQMKVQA